MKQRKVMCTGVDCGRDAYFGWYTIPLCEECKLDEDPGNHAALMIRETLRVHMVDHWKAYFPIAPRAVKDATPDYMGAVRDVVRGIIEGGSV